MNGMNMMSTLTSSARTALARGGQYGAVGVRGVIRISGLRGGGWLGAGLCNQQAVEGKGVLERRGHVLADEIQGPMPKTMQNMQTLANPHFCFGGLGEGYCSSGYTILGSLDLDQDAPGLRPRRILWLIC